MQKLFALAAALGFAACVACGESAAQKQAEEVKAKAEAAAKAAESTTKAGEALAKILTPTGADGKPVPILSPDALAGALPQVPGWEMEKPKAREQTTPFPFSQSQTTYKNGDAEIKMTVVDAAQANMMLLPLSMAMAAGYSKETSDGYEKAVTVGGTPGVERWRKNGNRGELTLLINQRFVVTIEGRDLTDTKVLHELAGKVNTGALK